MLQILSSQALITLFNQLFTSSHRTVLAGGAEEPLYRPAAESGGLHRIQFTRDYCASALHEVAHWCIAGERRRGLVDYGYWYVPDGRDNAQQRSFELVEVKPQALEWVFSQATGLPFRLSADNLDGQGGAGDEFKDRVWRQALNYCHTGLNERAHRFAEALARVCEQVDYLNPQRYDRDAL